MSWWREEDNTNTETISCSFLFFSLSLDFLLLTPLYFVSSLFSFLDHTFILTFNFFKKIIYSFLWSWMVQYSL